MNEARVKDLAEDAGAEEINGTYEFTAAELQDFADLIESQVIGEIR